MTRSTVSDLWRQIAALRRQAGDEDGAMRALHNGLTIEAANNVANSRASDNFR